MNIYTCIHTIECVIICVKKEVTMATNLQIDDKLIQTAVQLGGHRTKKEAVTQALVAYNQHLQQIRVLKLFGSIEYENDYNYKDQRSKK